MPKVPAKNKVGGSFPTEQEINSFAGVFIGKNAT